MKVRTVMTRNVMTLRPKDLLNIAYDLMKKHEIRHLPVVDDFNHLEGIISERDVLLHATYRPGEVEVPEIPVSEVMTTNLVTCRPSNTLSSVAGLMLERKVDSIPVTLVNGELVGIVTTADFLLLATENTPTSSLTCIPYDFVVGHFKQETPLRGPVAPIHRAYSG